MVIINRFPIKPYNNGLVKALYKTKEDIQVDGPTPVSFQWIFKEAILYDTTDNYYHSGEKLNISLNFKKYILISHFSVRTHYSNDSPAWPPENISINGCIDGSCIPIYREDISNRYNTIKMTLSPVSPGVFNMLNFDVNGSVIGYLEIFGYACDTLKECNGKLLMHKCTFNCNKYRMSNSFLLTLITSLCCHSQ